MNGRAESPIYRSTSTVACGQKGRRALASHEEQPGNLDDREERFKFIDEVLADEVERAVREAREELRQERSLRG